VSLNLYFGPIFQKVAIVKLF